MIRKYTVSFIDNHVIAVLLYFIINQKFYGSLIGMEGEKNVQKILF